MQMAKGEGGQPNFYFTKQPYLVKLSTRGRGSKKSKILSTQKMDAPIALKERKKTSSRVSYLRLCSTPCSIKHSQIQIVHFPCVAKKQTQESQWPKLALCLKKNTAQRSLLKHKPYKLGYTERACLVRILILRITRVITRVI